MWGQNEDDICRLSYQIFCFNQQLCIQNQKTFNINIYYSHYNLQIDKLVKLLSLEHLESFHVDTVAECPFYLIEKSKGLTTIDEY